MDYILGLDLGDNSLGWAVVETKNGNPCKLVDAGSRIFPEVIQRSETSSHIENPNQDRRAKRGARRVKARRVSRKQSLLETLVEAKLFPAEVERQHELFALDPYELRAGALQRELKPYEFGRALYHLAQRRGFKSNRKSVAEDKKKEEGQIAAEIGKLRKDMEEAGAETLGELLHDKARDKEKLEKGELRLRGQHFSRAMSADEFEKMWAAQAGYNPKLLNDPLRATIRDIVYFQRDFAVTAERRATLPSRANALRAPQLAPCSLLPDERRCSSDVWVAQQFRLLKEVNNIRVFEPYEERRVLTETEYQLLVRQLGRQKTMSFNAMRKLLKLSKETLFNLEEGKRKGLDGNIVEATLISAFGEKPWDSFDDARKNEIRYALSETEDPAVLENKAQSWGLSEEGVQEIMKFSPSGNHLRYSAKAMELLLPYLAQGLDEVSAVIQARQDGALPKRNEDEEQTLLPNPPESTNPNINRCLHQTRKVVNALIRKYGKPAKIVVELARSLKMSGVERERAIANNRENEKMNREATAWYEAHGRTRIRYDDRLIYKLWVEQNHTCVYSGKAISAADLLAEDNRLEVDHILPRSLSLDDSFNNKVLCFTQANRDKGQRTPHQWLGGPGNPAFDELLVRVKNMSGMSFPKRERFNQEKVDVDKIIERKLNDTRYASREVAEYVSMLYPPEERMGQKRVFTSPGGVTAALRRQWLLDYILDQKGIKNREDHRHHAVDAVAIACTDRKHVKALAEAMKREEYHLGAQPFDPPWPGFFDEVKYIVCDQKRTWKIDGQEIDTYGLLVSHMPMRKLSGALHKETNLGIPKEYMQKLENAKGAQFGPGGKFRKRIAVEGLSNKNLLDEEYIIDKTIRQIILDHLEAKGIDPNKALPKNWWENLAMPSGVPIRKVRVLEQINQPLLLAREKGGEIYTAVNTGNNHHMEIVEETDAKGRPKWVGVPVTMYEATIRARKEKKPIVQTQHDEGRKFVMSLTRNDPVFLNIDGKYILHRVQKMDVNGLIIFRPNTYSGLMKDTDKPPLIARKVAGSLNGNIYKVQMTILGDVESCHD